MHPYSGRRSREKKWHCHPHPDLCQMCVNIPNTALPPFPSLTAQQQGLSFSRPWWLGASQFARTNPHVRYHLKSLSWLCVTLIHRGLLPWQPLVPVLGSAVEGKVKSLGEPRNQKPSLDILLPPNDFFLVPSGGLTHFVWYFNNNKNAIYQQN